MKKYLYPSLLFKKKWVWFSHPSIFLEKGDLVTYFSYTSSFYPGFKRKKGITTVIHLDKGLDDIWGGMRKRFVRKQIERGQRNGVEVKRSFKLREFKKMYKEFRSSKGLKSEPFEVFEQNGVFFSAYHEEELIAGGIFISDGEYARALVLASKRFDDNLKNELVGQANRMVIWEAIKWGHAEGLKWVDLGGIDPDSSLAEFKEAFGGERIECFYFSKYQGLLKFIQKVRGILHI